MTEPTQEDAFTERLGDIVPIVIGIAEEPMEIEPDPLFASGYNDPQVSDDAVSHREFELLPGE